MTALPTIYITLYNRLTHNDLGEGTCCGIASSSTYNITYRAFRRCQSRTPAEGFVRFRQNIQNTLICIDKIIKKT